MRRGSDHLSISLGKPILCIWLVVLTARIAQAADLDLTRLSLEELMEIEVTLVSRKPEKLTATPAAAAVITAEDLRRSGVRSLPEALRLAPGMQVARVDANKWVVTARGFAGVFANKLLVLIDGRSVYTPLFSGVFWEVQDVVLEDVERIEVIRGPGGTLWGANAVNGIVNIATKSAVDTQGSLVQVGGGTAERSFGTVRYGGRLGEEVYYRAYGTFFRRARSSGATPLCPRDDWHGIRGGGRVDWRPSSRDALNLLADIYTGEVGQTLTIAASMPPPYAEIVHARASIDGFALVGRWERALGDRADLALQVYHDRAERAEPILHGVIANADVDFQHRFRWNSRMELAWGLGYRLTRDEFTGSFTMSLDPARRSVHLFSGFFHGDFALVPERLRLSLGSKIEHNAYTGLELQPNARLWWSPATPHALWGALSRAVRTPSRSERDFRGITQILPPDSLFSGSPVALVALLGDRQYDSEDLVALEMGYRTQLGDIALDLTGFCHLYDQVRTRELGLPVPEEQPSPPHLLVPVQVANKASAWTYGWEGVLNWQRWRRWRLRFTYSYLRMRLEADENSSDTALETFDEEVPRHQVSLCSRLDLSSGLELDVTGRYVDELPTQAIPGYLTVDLRLGWRPGARWGLSLVGRNLLDSPHREFISTSSATPPTEVEPSAHAVLTWKY